MSTKREKPSTKARRDGYARLNKLGAFLFKILYPNYKRLFMEDDDHWLEQELDKPGWRDYMIRHTPALKRGGPNEQKPSKSKRRQQKRKDRQSTIR